MFAALGMVRLLQVGMAKEKRTALGGPLGFFCSISNFTKFALIDLHILRIHLGGDAESISLKQRQLEWATRPRQFF